MEINHKGNSILFVINFNLISQMIYIYDIFPICSVPFLNSC